MRSSSLCHRGGNRCWRWGEDQGRGEEMLKRRGNCRTEAYGRGPTERTQPLRHRDGSWDRKDGSGSGHCGDRRDADSLHFSLGRARDCWKRGAKGKLGEGWRRGVPAKLNGYKTRLEGSSCRPDGRIMPQRRPRHALEEQRNMRRYVIDWLGSDRLAL